MPRSCRCILDRAVFKGAMSEEDRDKIMRNLKMEWIPVTEKLPGNEHKKYIVTLDNGEVENRWWLGCFWVESVGRVTAWMPLPEPYEEGAEE